MTERKRLPAEEEKRQAARQRRLDQMQEKARDLTHIYRYMHREFQREGKDFSRCLYGAVLRNAMEAQDLLYQDLRAETICRDYHRLLRTMMVERRLYHDLMDFHNPGSLNRELEKRYTHNGVLSPAAADDVIRSMDLGPEMKKVSAKMISLQPVDPEDPNAARYEKVLEKLAFRNLAEKLYRRCRHSIEAAASLEQRKQERKSMDVPKLSQEQYRRVASPALGPMML